jgi:hypothetical protein
MRAPEEASWLISATTLAPATAPDGGAEEDEGDAFSSCLRLHAEAATWWRWTGTGEEGERGGGQEVPPDEVTA